jgi:hypothetical protein
MKRVLLISPHFPPVNAPDMQRARQSLLHLANLGWEPEVLAVEPESVAAGRDPLLASSLPVTIPIHRVRTMSPAFGRLIGRGTLGRRAVGPLAKAGDDLLRRRRYDLVFFTTTQFSVLTLGPRWLHAHGVPYVVDWQDPWVTDYYDQPGAPRPPGGWKYRFAAQEARRLEGACLQEAAGLVSTSPAYVGQLRDRYPWFAAKPMAVIPFGAEPADFETAERAKVAPAFVHESGFRHFVYVGAAGPIMEPALRLLFAGLVEHLRATPGDRAKLRFHFIGTSYAPAGQETPSVLPLAEAAGVRDLVREQPERVGHFAAVATLRAADTLLLLGSADAGYSPSKIATLALAGRPVLALIPGGGQLDETMTSLRFAQVARFSPAAEIDVVRDYLANPPPRPAPSPALAQLTAAARTRELVAFFDQVLAGSPRP